MTMSAAEMHHMQMQQQAAAMAAQRRRITWLLLCAQPNTSLIENGATNGDE